MDLKGLACQTLLLISFTCLIEIYILTIGGFYHVDLYRCSVAFKPG